MSAEVHGHVRERYAEAALNLSAGCGCGCDCEAIGCCGEEETTLFGQGLYAPADRLELPENAVAASLGCGNPVAVAEMHEGETVLDLGSGGGIDVLLSARRVGPNGHGLRARHDRRDARSRPEQRSLRRRHERPLPEGVDRGNPAPRPER